MILKKDFFSNISKGYLIFVAIIFATCLNLVEFYLLSILCVEGDGYFKFFTLKYKNINILVFVFARQIKIYLLL